MQSRDSVAWHRAFRSTAQRSAEPVIRPVLVQRSARNCPKSRILACTHGAHLTCRKISSILVSPCSVQPGIRRLRNRVEEEEALRTCEEFLAVINRQHSVSPPRPLVGNTHKLNVIYPSRSSSYFLNTSVILFKLIQACTNKSKLSPFSLPASSPRPLTFFA